MGVWLAGCMDAWMDAWIHGRVDNQIDIRTEWLYGQYRLHFPVHRDYSECNTPDEGPLPIVLDSEAVVTCQTVAHL